VHHQLDVVLGHAVLEQPRDQRLLDEAVVPLGQQGHHALLREPVRRAVAILGQDDLRRVAPLAQLDQRGLLVLERVVDLEPAAVEAQVGAGLEHLDQVVDVAGLVGVADEHAREVDALLAQDPLLVQPALGLGVGVGHDRHVGAQVGLGDRADQALDVGRDAGLVGAALHDARADVGALDALLDVAHEEVDQERVVGIGVEEPARAVVLHGERQVGVGVVAGHHDDVEARPLDGALDALDLAPQAGRGHVHDRVDARGLDRLQLLVGVGDHRLLVLPAHEARPRLLELRRADEDVLVHERAPHLGRVDLSADDRDPRHVGGSS
jgi:hypothetical protein